MGRPSWDGPFFLEFLYFQIIINYGKEKYSRP